MGLFLCDTVWLTEVEVNTVGELLSKGGERRGGLEKSGGGWTIEEGGGRRVVWDGEVDNDSWCEREGGRIDGVWLVGGDDKARGLLGREEGVGSNEGGASKGDEHKSCFGWLGGMMDGRIEGVDCLVGRIEGVDFRSGRIEGVDFRSGRIEGVDFLSVGGGMMEGSESICGGGKIEGVDFLSVEGMIEGVDFLSVGGGKIEGVDFLSVEGIIEGSESICEGEIIEGVDFLSVGSGITEGSESICESGMIEGIDFLSVEGIIEGVDFLSIGGMIEGIDFLSGRLETTDSISSVEGIILQRCCFFMIWGLEGVGLVGPWYAENVGIEQFSGIILHRYFNITLGVGGDGITSGVGSAFFFPL